MIRRLQIAVRLAFVSLKSRRNLLLENLAPRHQLLVLSCQNNRPRLFWRWKSRPRRSGRRTLHRDTIELIRQMSRANPLWGAPRIHGEFLKFGIHVAQRSVAKCSSRDGLDVATHPTPTTNTYPSPLQHVVASLPIQNGTFANDSQEIGLVGKKVSGIIGSTL